MKQSISTFEICAIIGSFVGIIMISLGRPEDGGADSKRIAQLTGPFYEWLGINGIYILGICLAVVLAVLFSCIGLLSRELKNMHYSIIMFNYALLLTLTSGLFMICDIFI